MSLLLSCQNIGKTFGARPLFTGITLGLNEGERCGVFGPNGAGKSTLMKILAGRLSADEGSVETRKGIGIGYVAQEDRFTGATVQDELLQALRDEHLEAHEKQTRVAIMLTRIGFVEPAAAVAALSGGWRKRLALAREMVLQPDLLFLDEPTNHLDLEGISWLENLLEAADFAYMVVTHDRYFLENVTNRVMEINRVYSAGYLAVPGTYSDFLERREVALQAQLNQQQAMQNKARGEIAWLRRGPKARRTKRKTRIDEAHALLEDLAEIKSRNTQEKAAGIQFAATERKTRKLLAAHELVKAMGDRSLINKLNLVLSPGMRFGVLGPNGSGKSTLLKLLTGNLPPDAGTIKRAADLRIVFFDQQRQTLNKSELLRNALAPGSDTVIYNGQQIHLASWAKRFLFRIEQLDQPVGDLSGGEQARILIARLMLTPADVLVLDEPTNDLDIPSLEVLEESLEEFPGALVLVTHDRFMLDRLSTEILGLDGRGGHGIFTDYAQYEAWAKAGEKQRAQAQRAAAAHGAPGGRDEANRIGAGPSSAVVKKSPGKRLSYKEQQDWGTIESRIMEAEQQVEVWRKALEDPAVMADRVKLPEACEALHAAQEQVTALYARWQELDAKANGG